MEKSVYLVVYKTDGYEDIFPYSSRAKADNCFENLVEKFKLTESEEHKCWYVREAYGNGKAATKSGDASLILAKKIIDFCSI